MTAHAPVQLTFDGLPGPAGTPSDRSRVASAHRTDALLASLAVHGAWTIPAAMRLGLSRQRIRSRIEAGRWILCAGSAYCDPRQADDIRVRAAAAQLSLDVGTVWGRTAGILHGLPLDDDGAICQGTVRSARGRSWDLPGDGHEFCPVMAMGSAQRLAITGPRGQVNGLTP